MPSCKDAAAGAGLLAVTLAGFLLSYHAHFRGGWTFEFCHYAEIASNILGGKGLATNTFWPCELATLERADPAIALPDAGPVVARFPLYAYWSALWMAIGRGDFGMALGNGVAHGLWVILIYAIGLALFSRRAALLAAALWAVHPMMSGAFDLSGHPDVLFGVIFGALSFLFWRSLQGRGTRAAFEGLGLGVLAGAALLARTSFSVWLPLFLALPPILKGRAGWRISAQFLLGFGAVSIPYSLYYLRHVGTLSAPLLLWNLAQGVLVPGLPWMEYRTYSFSDFLHAAVLQALFYKAFSNFNLALKDIPQLWSLHVALPFAAAGMMARQERDPGLAGWLLALLGWQLAVFSFLRYDNRYYLWFAPFILLYAVGFLESKSAIKAWRLGGGLALVLLASSWLALSLSLRYAEYPVHPSGLPIKDWPELEYLRHSTPETAGIVTNIPAQVAWYCRRRTYNITNRPEDLPRLLARWPADYLLISRNRIGELPHYPAWTALLNDRPRLERTGVLPGFRLEKAFDDGDLFVRTPCDPRIPDRPSAGVR